MSDKNLTYHQKYWKENKHKINANRSKSNTEYCREKRIDTTRHKCEKCDFSMKNELFCTNCKDCEFCCFCLKDRKKI